MPPTEGDVAPDFEALYCDGDAFRARRLSETLDERGGVVVFFGFVFNAIGENWWKRYARAGWGEFDVPVVGVGRDGPYSMNEFIRQKDLPFAFFADLECDAARAYDLLVEREGMAGVHTPKRAVYVLDGDREVKHVWSSDDWIHPVPREEIEAAVADL
ncbi:redoxin domain-containing protein [Halorarius halobius]|uniref:redoxin domain-containing protein n=1 Tax=Halorarius halobius TaxID=2962671 RepID=UPI0020CC88CC|nr:redoxin domain-containing protein [Halorarius halobius]